MSRRETSSIDDDLNMQYPQYVRQDLSASTRMRSEAAWSWRYKKDQVEETVREAWSTFSVCKSCIPKTQYNQNGSRWSWIITDGIWREGRRRLREMRRDGAAVLPLLPASIQIWKLSRKTTKYGAWLRGLWPYDKTLPVTTTYRDATWRDSI